MFSNGNNEYNKNIYYIQIIMSLKEVSGLLICKYQAGKKWPVPH